MNLWFENTPCAERFREKKINTENFPLNKRETINLKIKDYQKI
tara:strand:+ start:59 stop:187 length:129 start_codon:yes stop_codon:yes gene_type:complete